MDCCKDCHRLSVAASSSSSVSVPGVHLLRRTPAVVRRSPAIVRRSPAAVCRTQAPSLSGRGARSSQPTNRSFFIELGVFECALRLLSCRTAAVRRHSRRLGSVSVALLPLCSDCLEVRTKV
ncbi:uncharacterized protein DS421_14g460600 [Arachis hypogaea]|nr:uncharacterized protein DS421_14g460600 [Arachis hypogaea]